MPVTDLALVALDLTQKSLYLTPLEMCVLLVLLRNLPQDIKSTLHFSAVPAIKAMCLIRLQEIAAALNSVLCQGTLPVKN